MELGLAAPRWLPALAVILAPAKITTRLEQKELLWDNNTERADPNNGNLGDYGLAANNSSRKRRKRRKVAQTKVALQTFTTIEVSNKTQN
ncbi:hypothetical protein ACJMK2_015608 [Sinanodonta woodiana]|uniref:Secreted protein n=1 Tax=Sinanodonta woodiana TaxID=1069815 RepID=A0ABD3UUQ8_SINWO